MRTWLAAALLLAGCGAPAKPVDAACTAVIFEQARFTDCIARPGLDQVRLVTDPQLRDLPALIDRLGNAAAQVRFAMNGGMYNDAGQPIGLAVNDGKLIHPLNRKPGPGNFHLLPNGVFSAEPDGWHVRTSDAFAALPPGRASMATQSGPMLVIAGQLHPKIAPDGTSLHVRNAVGIDAQRRAHFVISDEAVSFGKLARLLRDRLGCRDALFLDGSVSSLWDPAAGRIDQLAQLGPLLVVEAR